MEMDFHPDIITSITSALNSLRWVQKFIYYNDSLRVDMLIEITINKLKGLRTFVLCSKKLGNLDPSLLERIEELASRFTEFIRSNSPRVYDHVSVFLRGIESLEDEIDAWYKALAECLQDSSPPVACQLEDIADSVVDSLDNYIGFLVNPVESLKESIAFWRNFLQFSTRVFHETLEIHDLLTHIEPLIISAAHLSARLFSATLYNLKVLYDDTDKQRRKVSCDGMESILSALLLRVDPLSNPLLHEAYIRALASFNISRCNTRAVVNFEFLVSTLWEMLQWETTPVALLKDKLQELYEGLRYLRTILKKHKNKFKCKSRDATGAAIVDAGIMMFSVHQKDFVIDHGLKDFLEIVRVIREDEFGVKRVGFPRTNALGFLDSLLVYLEEVKSSKLDSGTLSCIPEIRGYLVFLRSVAGKLAELKNQQEDLRSLWNYVARVTYSIEYLIDQMVLGNILNSFAVSIQSISKDIMAIKDDAVQILDDRRLQIKVPQEASWTPDQVQFQSSIKAPDEFVGFETEKSTFINRLMRGSKKLKVVAIVGMPGLGKTTLATKVYNDPSVVHHFNVRAWCSISQVFNKRKVLLELLNHIVTKLQDEYLMMNEDDLAQAVWRSLKGRRYLIFLDDIWDIQSFHFIRDSLPDDCTESRIFLTSRHYDVASLDEQPHFLRQLTISESLELLRRRLIFGNHCHTLLTEFGRKIAEHCKGLPLTIHIVAGLLTSTERQVWKEILENLKSGIISGADQCESSIELSYKHLPDHLKPCFLSFGAFPEDQKVPVKRLTWLWIAEGFVTNSTESKSLEEVATDYLMVLIGRSLIMSAEVRSRGGIKACRIHDLLRDFCLRKANEESFLHILKGIDEFDTFEDPSNIRRLCVCSQPEHLKQSMLFCPRLRSLMFFRTSEWYKKLHISSIIRIFKLLRVLDVEQVSLIDFPAGIGLLLQLRYLAIRCLNWNIGPSIGNLSNLETLILHSAGSRDVVLPHTCWKLQKLRHLYLSHMDGECGIELPVEDLDILADLVELQILSCLYADSWSIMERQLKKIPNTRQLKCWLYEYGNDPENGSKVMSFSSLSKLESLNMSFSRKSPELHFVFPDCIKKLSLHKCKLPWSKISSIAELPNLEVLKLLANSFFGDIWHVEEGEFPKLKFLRLVSLDVVKWTACDDQFLSLEKLVLDNCLDLDDIPECLENAPSLEMIEIINCSNRVADLFKRVEDYQKDVGNLGLQLLVRFQNDSMTLLEEYLNDKEDNH